MSSSPNLMHLLQSLQVPSNFARYENITEELIIAHLNEWRDNAHQILTDIWTLAKENALNMTLQEQADVVSAVAMFEGNDPWTTPISRTIAKDILAQYSKPSDPLLIQLLNKNIKPIFQSNPHPFLNANTGRKLPRPAGGPMASQDQYEGQVWKDCPGISRVVSWCVRYIKREAYESLWHLIIPPIMVLLDDYEARYKLQGVEIVSLMLQHAPKELLKRTGVDSLIRASLRTCLTHLENPETPQLLRAAIAASLSLILLSTVPGEAEYFNQLCAILGEGIISGIWLYGAEKPEIILASLDALPPLLSALGVGNARFLKVLIPQLIQPLKTNQLNGLLLELQISSLRALAVLIVECAQCMPRWKYTILDGIGRCWVTLLDTRGGTPDTELGEHLRRTCELLAKACPSVIQEYRILVAADQKVFGDLLDRISSI